MDLFQIGPAGFPMADTSGARWPNNIVIRRLPGSCAAFGRCFDLTLPEGTHNGRKD